MERSLLRELELDEIESETEEYINRLSSNFPILQRCNKDWSTLILKEVKGEVKATEEREYTCIAEGEEGSIEVILVANDTLARLKARITLILRKHEQAFCLRPLTSSSQEQLQPIVKQAAVQVTRVVIQESLSHSCTQNDTTDTSIRLPKMLLPNFDGNVLKWPEFWNVFESSVDQQNISDVIIDKFSHLRGVLCGTAFMAISGILLTNENYSVVVAILKVNCNAKFLLLKYVYLSMRCTKQQFL